MIPVQTDAANRLVNAAHEHVAKLEVEVQARHSMALARLDALRTLEQSRDAAARAAAMEASALHAAQEQYASQALAVQVHM